MSEFQLYVYYAGCFAFLLGCFFYYLKSNKEITTKQKKIRSLIMNIFLSIAFICIVLSFFNIVPVAQ
tara:strand:- start:113 stop:313 length:201 start_codon:yes stop_codon:yes gene_type:complete